MMCSCAWAQSQPSEQPQPRQAEAQRASRNQQQSQPPINITVTTPDRSAEEKRAEADRANRQDATNKRIAEANDRMATFTFWLVIVGVLQLGAAALTFGVARKSARIAHHNATIALAQKRIGDRQLEQMAAQVEIAKTSADAAKQSADTAALALEQADRPWVKVSCRLLKIEATEEQGVSVEALFQISNVGGHVAQNVTICPSIVPMGSRAEGQKGFAIFDKFTPENPPTIGTVLFPNDPRQERHAFSLDKSTRQRKDSESQRDFPACVAGGSQSGIAAAALLDDGPAEAGHCVRGP